MFFCESFFHVRTPWITSLYEPLILIGLIYGEQVIYDHAEAISSEIDPRKHPALGNQIIAFKKYKKFREKFGPYVSFDKPDSGVRTMIEDTPDNRWFAFEKPVYSVLGTVGAAGAGVAVALCPPLWPFCLGAAATSGSVALNGIRHWWFPTDKEKDRAAFFKSL